MATSRAFRWSALIFVAAAILLAIAVAGIQPAGHPARHEGTGAAPWQPTVIITSAVPLA